MKQRKITITALIFIAVGVVLFFSAHALGAEGYITWRLGSGLRVGSLRDKATLSGRDIKGVTSLQIHSVEADIEFIPAPDYGFELTTYGENPEWSIENGVLTVSEYASEAPVSMFNLIVPPMRSSSAVPYIKIYYPENTTPDTLDIKSVSGNISFPGVSGTVRSASFITVSGDIEARALEADTLRLQSVSGVIRTRGVTADSGYLETSSGDAVIEDFNGEMDGETVSGAITLTAEKLSGRLNSVSGDIKITAAEPRLALSTMSGNVKITSSARESDTRYDLNTLSGVITINGNKTEGHAISAHGGSFHIDAEATSGDISVELGTRIK
ncbi:MAG: DUF4097 domain-containing protein [Oscillospiraceae bacterium]|jgi:DUF4097 and DUF4098 domain-containing protein YvlB|nr:DUF4097 domain-containing protein [Oscillospiraceae bacterium]